MTLPRSLIVLTLYYRFNSMKNLNRSHRSFDGIFFTKQMLLTSSRKFREQKMNENPTNKQTKPIILVESHIVDVLHFALHLTFPKIANAAALHISCRRAMHAEII